MTLEKFKEEAKSFLTTFASALLFEGILNLSIFEGDFSKDALKALGFAILRVILKTLVTLSTQAPIIEPNITEATQQDGLEIK
jgi:hypothetical protein